MGKLARSPASERDYDYVVTGSAQNGNPETLRVNMRIVDAATSEFVWAGRHEFHLEELAPIQTRITRRISRELHLLLLQAASRRAFYDAGTEHSVTEALSRAASALQQGMRAELSAEAQRWYLTALASDPRNVEALTGLAITCQISSATHGGPSRGSWRPPPTWPRSGSDRALHRAGAQRRALCTRDVVFGCRTTGRGWGRVRPRSGNRSKPGYRARVRRIQCCLSRTRR
jgi:uncharacterized protein (DUF1778 family)